MEGSSIGIESVFKGRSELMVRNIKQSYKALKKAKEKYRTIFENSKDMVFITTMDGKFIEINQAGMEMLGYSDKNELMGTKVSDTYLHREVSKVFRKEIAKEGFLKDFEAKLKRKDGTTVDCLITATLRKDGKGDAIGYEGIIKNISDRKKMEEELFQRAKELQTLYDLGDFLNRSLELGEVLPIALEKSSNLTGFESGGIYLYNEKERICELRFHKGCSPAFVDRVRSLKYGEGVCGRAIQLRKPVYLSIDEYPFTELLPIHKEEGTRSLIGIPLLAKGKVTGAITLSSRSIRTLSQREINLLESIGSQIGLVLENAKLFSNVAKAKSEWETTFDAVTDLITIKDKDYRILRANRAAFEGFGLKPEEMIGRKCFEVLHHRAKPCERCYLSRTLITKKPASGERESKYLNGVIQYHTFPVCDEGGEVIAVVDIAREITEQKRLEREKDLVNNVNKILASSLDVRQVMQAVHSELRKVLKSERMTITILLEKGEWYRFFSLNEDLEAKEMTGSVTYPIEGTPIKKVLETGLPVIITDSAEIDSWFHQRLLREGIRSSLFFPLEYKGKVIGTINLSSGETNHFSENQFDFLYQISAGLAISIENSLLLDGIRKSEEKYRSVVESAFDGVLVMGEDRRCIYVNGRISDITGYTRKELIGMDFRDLLDDASRQLMADQYTRRQKGEEVPPPYELNVIRKDGDMRNVEINSAIVRDSQGNVNTIAFLKDTTEKKRMGEELLHSEKLRALGEMVSGVAHEFNNALAVILGNTQLLLHTAEDEGLKESLKVIEKVSQKSAQSVKRLQNFTRRGVPQALFEMDVNSIIRDSIEITKPKWKDEAQSRGTDIEIITNFGEILPILGNASDMGEVITNMIFNAIEAMPEGGKIEMRTFRRESKVHIQISDTGIGMTEEVIKKAFEPFFTTKPFSNSGLGLSMSYGIVKRFGGEIQVASEVGYGTTFTIILPAGLKRKERADDLPIIKKGGKAQILVIDDEEEVRSVLLRILSQVGRYRVTIAENGEEGIRLFREKDFDMVLTDLGMPGMSGWEVCKVIKKMTPHTPVGMITGWGVKIDQAKIEEAGINFVISKPFQLEQILKVLDETLTSKS